MQRKVLGLALFAVLLVSAHASADPHARMARARGSGGSTTRRVVWTLVGAGAGFAAGLMFGLYKFDDAIDSDRKVWTSAIVGAAGGAVAGGLLSRAFDRPALWPAGARREASVDRLTRDLPTLGARPDDDRALRARVRAANVRIAGAAPVGED